MSPPLRTVDAMSCTTIPDPLQDLLAAVAAHPGIPIARLDPEQYAVAVAYGWVYGHRGLVGLTGVGAWRVAMERRGLSFRRRADKSDSR